jgi:hypothetical protein
MKRTARVPESRPAACRPAQTCPSTRTGSAAAAAAQDTCTPAQVGPARARALECECASQQRPNAATAPAMAGARGGSGHATFMLEPNTCADRPRFAIAASNRRPRTMSARSFTGSGSSSRSEAMGSGGSTAADRNRYVPGPCVSSDAAVTTDDEELRPAPSRDTCMWRYPRLESGVSTRNSPFTRPFA